MCGLISTYFKSVENVYFAENFVKHFNHLRVASFIVASVSVSIIELELEYRVT